jgi:hypothetical protein
MWASARRRVWVVGTGLICGTAFGAFRHGRVAPRHLAFNLDQTLIISMRTAQRNQEHTVQPPSSEVATTAPNIPPAIATTVTTPLWRTPDMITKGHSYDAWMRPHNYDVWMRPHSRWAISVLQRMGMHISLYTSAKQTYADEIVDRLYPGIFPAHARLYREQCVDPRGRGKDLRRSVVADAHPLDAGDVDAKVARAVLIDDRISNRIENQNFRVLSYTSPADTDKEMLKLVAWVICAHIVGLPDPTYKPPTSPPVWLTRP